MSTAPLISCEAKKRGGLDFRVYQDLKIGIHRDLLTHVDLEKVTTQPDDLTRRQVYAVIQELVSNLKTLLTASEKERDRLLPLRMWAQNNHREGERC